MLGAVSVGALIRFLYIATFVGRTEPAVGGDGWSYHLDAIRLSDGLGYTDGLFRIGEQVAHHPPGWVTVLGGFSALGIDSIQGHQMIAAAIGVLVILLAAFIGRKLFGDITGAVAGVFAAVYPGFWVLEAQILAEPLAILLLGLTIIALYRLSERTNLSRILAVAVLLGCTALVRSELLALLLVVPVILWRAKAVPLLRRALLGLITLGCVAMILSPWVIHNAQRFDETVILSSNMGGTLLSGNCDSTFTGDKLGFYDVRCLQYVDKYRATTGAKVADRLYRKEAVAQIMANLEKLPWVVAARFGRALGFYRTDQTVQTVAVWQGTPTWPVWAWVISFWFVLILAVLGLVTAIRARSELLPLIAPILVVIGTIAVFYGEPRYHTMADLSLIVLAALGAVTAVKHSRALISSTDPH